MKVLLAAVLLLLGTALPAAAGDEEVCAPQAPVLICGETRAIVLLENRRSSVPAVFRLVWWTPITNERVRDYRWVAPGSAQQLRRWVHGGARKVSVYDEATGEMLARVTVDEDHLDRWPGLPYPLREGAGRGARHRAPRPCRPAARVRTRPADVVPQRLC